MASLALNAIDQSVSTIATRNSPNEIVLKNQNLHWQEQTVSLPCLTQTHFSFGLHDWAIAIGPAETSARAKTIFFAIDMTFPFERPPSWWLGYLIPWFFVRQFQTIGEWQNLLQNMQEIERLLRWGQQSKHLE
jgi:hypothetical protein